MNGQVRRFYLPQLDGLRFIAFMLVFLHNAPKLASSTFWTALHDYGWIGVDLFFCLSAFLITKLLLLEQNQNGRVNIFNFYLRRILRIWPLYFFYILLATFLIMQDQGWNVVLPYHLTGLVTFTYNFFYLSLTHKIYFLFVHLWTISYEEQFYAVIPWTINALAKRHLSAKLVLIVLLLLGTIIRAALIIEHAKHPTIYMLPFTHFESVLFGVAIGAGYFDKLLGRFPGWLLFVFGVLLNAAVFSLPNNYVMSWSLMLTYPLVGIGMALIVFSMVSKPDSIPAKILSVSFVAFLGKISYGLYMYHILSLYLVEKVLAATTNLASEESTLPLLIASLMLTLFLAVVSYNALEKGFLKFKTRFSRINSRPI